MHHAGLCPHWIQQVGTHPASSLCLPLHPSTILILGILILGRLQNHDSLPQKAGYPQHALNEIHGSLHDPSNPIVPYEGSLRDDLYAWMCEWRSKADLCLAIGTSLSGFNVDSVPEQVAERQQAAAAAKAAQAAVGSIAAEATDRDGCLGLVLINLQQTPYDASCSLRLFCKADEAMAMLAEELGLDETAAQIEQQQQQLLPPECVIEEDVFRIPFDHDGVPLRAAAPLEKWSVLDLRIGKSVRLTGGPYSGDVGVITGKNACGHYSMRLSDSINPTFNVKRRPFTLWLGGWWLRELCGGHAHGCSPGDDLCPCVSIASPDASTEKEGLAKLHNESKNGIEKYLRLSRIGLPLQAIRCAMAADGVPKRVADEYIMCGDMESRDHAISAVH
jgi:hypothetical protein